MSRTFLQADRTKKLVSFTVSDAAREHLAAISKNTGESKSAIVERLILGEVILGATKAAPAVVVPKVDHGPNEGEHPQIAPFAGPQYSKNEERCRDDDYPCAHCGLPCKRTGFGGAVRIVDGGSRYASKHEHEGLIPVEESSDLACYPVGPACAKRLRKAGVYVFDWSEI